MTLRPGGKTERLHPVPEKQTCMPLSSDDIEVRRVFRLHMAIAYEDLVTGQRAINIYQRLKQQHSIERCQYQHSLWRFKDLGLQSSRETAAEDVALADVALISAHGIIQLPVEVQNWIELWMEKEPGPSALVVLLDRRAIDSGSAVRDYLQEVARSLEIPFFLNGIESAEAPAGELSEATLLTVSDFPSWAPVGDPISRWGINE